MQGKELRRFTVPMKWAGTLFLAEISVYEDGWGEIFDTADGDFVGSISPERVAELMKKAEGKDNG